MIRDFIPRLLIYPLIIIFIINLSAIHYHPPVNGPQFAAMVRLLKWRDPVSGNLLNLPIDRSIPLNQQVIELHNYIWQIVN